MFDGSYYVPAMPGNGVVIAYVGPVGTALSDDAVHHPAIEPARTNGARSASVQRLAPGSYTFGVNRISATLSPTTLRVIGGGETSAIVLRCRSVPTGHYALLCGPNAYELEIE